MPRWLHDTPTRPPREDGTRRRTFERQGTCCGGAAGRGGCWKREQLHAPVFDQERDRGTREDEEGARAEVEEAPRRHERCPELASNKNAK